MLHLKLLLINPWFVETISSFQNFGSWEPRVSKNKCLCLETYRYKRDLLGIDLDLNWRGKDHAGPNLEITLFTYAIHVQLYDVRHWNHTENRWMTKEEHQAEAHFNSMYGTITDRDAD